MSHPDPFSQWIETVSSMLPRVEASASQSAGVLELWHVLARSCGITLVCAALALQVHSSEQSLLQCLREWCYNADDKKELLCQAPLGLQVERQRRSRQSVDVPWSSCRFQRERVKFPPRLACWQHPHSVDDPLPILPGMRGARRLPAPPTNCATRL